MCVLLGFWAIGLPSSYILGFYAGLGIHGIYFGLVITAVFLATTFTVKILKSDWFLLSKKIHIRLCKEGDEIEVI